MRSLRRALYAAFGLLAGCGTSGGPVPAELAPLAGAREVRPAWNLQVGLGEGYVFAPASAGDALFAASRNGTVLRLDAASGEERWRAALETPLSAGVGADGSFAVVATDKGEVIALDARTGEARWRARASSEVIAPPLVAGALVLVRSVDNRISAFGAADGKRRWVYQRAPASLIVRSHSGMTRGGDTLYAGFPGGKLVALALESGSLRWEATVALPRGATELERVTDVVGDPAVLDREVCAAAYQGRVACFEAASGTQTWSRELSSLTGVALDARHAYVSDERGAVHALDRTNGRSLWKQDRLGYRQLTLPLPLGNQVAVADFEGYVHFLSRDTGAFVGRAETDGYGVRAAPVALARGFMLQTSYGGLYVFP